MATSAKAVAAVAVVILRKRVIRRGVYLGNETEPVTI
jgi:hypothetical protein